MFDINDFKDQLTLNNEFFKNNLVADTNFKIFLRKSLAKINVLNSQNELINNLRYILDWNKIFNLNFRRDTSFPSEVYFESRKFNCKYSKTKYVFLNGFPETDGNHQIAEGIKDYCLGYVLLDVYDFMFTYNF